MTSLMLLAMDAPPDPGRTRNFRALFAAARLLVCLVVWWLAASVSAFAAEGEETVLERAVLVTESGERPVELPHRLEVGDFDPDGSRVRYRLTIELDQAPGEPLGVLTRKLSLSGRLLVNGRPAGACGTGPLELLRCLHQPQLFVPPEDLWTVGRNTLEFEIYANDRQMNGLGRVLVGDAQRLDAGPYRDWMLWQVESIHGLSWITLTLVVLSFAVWAVLRSDPVYLWFGIAGLTNAASNLNVLITTPPVSFELFSWFVFAIRMSSVALIQLMLLSFFGKATPLRQRALLGYALLTPALLWIAGSDRWIVVGLYVPMLLAGAALLIGMVRWSYRSKRWSEALMTLAYGITFALGQLDFARLGGVGAFEGVYLMVYASAAMAAVIGATLVGLLASTLATARRLTHTLDREVAMRTADLERANARLEELSSTDGLTGIANRRRFEEALADAWRRARRDSGVLSLAMIDVDHFKHYNDALGHLAGDDCLRHIAQAVRAHARRADDLAARYGGEEFALLVRADLDDALDLAEALRSAVFEAAIPHPDSPYERVTVSIGVASLEASEGVTPSELVRLADEALYVAKRAGRNRVKTAP